MIVNRLSRLLGERRLTIQALAERSGVSYTALHKLYHDRTDRFDRGTLDRLCAALGVGVGDLLEYRAEEAKADEGHRRGRAA